MQLVGVDVDQVEQVLGEVGVELRQVDLGAVLEEERLGLVQRAGLGPTLPQPDDRVEGLLGEERVVEAEQYLLRLAGRGAGAGPIVLPVVLLPPPLLVVAVVVVVVVVGPVGVQRSPPPTGVLSWSLRAAIISCWTPATLMPSVCAITL